MGSPAFSHKHLNEHLLFVNVCRTFFYIKINLPQLDIQVPYQPPQPPPADVARAKVTNHALNKTLIMTCHSLPCPPPGAPPLRPPCAAWLQGGRGLNLWKVPSLLSSWVGGNPYHSSLQFLSLFYFYHFISLLWVLSPRI